MGSRSATGHVSAFPKDFARLLKAEIAKGKRALKRRKKKLEAAKTRLALLRAEQWYKSWLGET